MRAATQVAATHARSNPASVPASSAHETWTTVIRSGIRIGDEKGSHDITFEKVLVGSSRIGWMNKIEETSKIVTGSDACCTSCSLVTVEPIAAKSAA